MLKYPLLRPLKKSSVLKVYLISYTSKLLKLDALYLKLFNSDYENIDILYSFPKHVLFFFECRTATHKD